MDVLSGVLAGWESTILTCSLCPLLLLFQVRALSPLPSEVSVLAVKRQDVFDG